MSVSGSAAMSLDYDPLGRLARSIGVDEPIVWYEGGGLGDRRFMHTDHQGSIVAASDGAGAIAGAPYAYSAYGEPQADDWSGARFRYTGQIALPEVKLYHYKARVYDPKLGRFLQTDPIGYEDQWNLYAYVGNDPVNTTDPSGKCPWCLIGAGASAGVQIYLEAKNGSFSGGLGSASSWNAVGRIALAGGAGALSGGAGLLIGSAVRGGSLVAIGGRVAGNSVAGAAISAAQTAGNASIEGKVATSAELKSAAQAGAFWGAAGGAAGEGLQGATNKFDPKVAAAEAGDMARAMVQGSNAPGGMSLEGLRTPSPQSALGPALSNAGSTALTTPAPLVTPDPCNAGKPGCGR